MDTKGPEVRSGDVAEPLQLAAGDRVVFTIQEGADGKDNRISGGAWAGRRCASLLYLLCGLAVAPCLARVPCRPWRPPFVQEPIRAHGQQGWAGVNACIPPQLLRRLLPPAPCSQLR